MTLRLKGWGLSVPGGSIEQSTAADAAIEIWGEAAGVANVLPALYRRAGVQRRHSVLIESPPAGATGPIQTFYPVAASEADRGPSTQARMERFEAAALPLAVEACGRALDDAHCAPRSITHLVTVSCSGFEAPGVDLGLIERLRLKPGVSRTHIGFMGCHGAFNALRVARAFAESDPHARVLVCCVELCSLHQQYSSDPQQIVANALFADGAAAVVADCVPDDSTHWVLHSQHSLVLTGTADLMGWRIKDHGFQMTLSPQVPDIIRDQLHAWLTDWLTQEGLSLAEIPSWAIHPGGPRILSACAEALSLSAGQLDVSKSVLADYGNMSSPTILFILNRLRQSSARSPCLALAFGPGLTIEAALWRSSR